MRLRAVKAHRAQGKRYRAQQLRFEEAHIVYAVEALEPSFLSYLRRMVS